MCLLGGKSVWKNAGVQMRQAAVPGIVMQIKPLYPPAGLETRLSG